MTQKEIDEILAHKDRKYTKGDCYALCEFLESLLRDCDYVIDDIASALGYEKDRMVNLLQDLASDINDTICDEQDERDDTDQMADIMQIVHISGHDD